ncbi:MAG: DUF2164 domain-containing protein [bacterium]
MSKDFKTIEISKEKRLDMIGHIKDYFQRENDEEIGDLGAGILLDFIIKELAPEFYNQGINDSYLYINDKILDVLGLQK